VLDTGASRTTITTDVADQLSISLSKERKARVQVVGGAVIEARVVRMNHLTVGPHTKRNADVFVIPHEGPAAGYDGLLGMDVLRGVKYRVDFKSRSSSGIGRLRFMGSLPSRGRLPKPLCRYHNPVADLNVSSIRGPSPSRPPGFPPAP